MSTVSRWLLLIAIPALILGGCSGPGAGGGGTAAIASPLPEPALDGRTYVSTHVTRDGAASTLVAGTRIRLAFEGRRLTASAGCNTMGAEYRVQDGRLQIGDLATTAMGCDPERHAQDEWLARFLGGRPAIRASDSDLALEQGGTVIAMLDREVAEPDLPLVGTVWTVVAIFAGDTVSTPPGTATATLFFGPDGRLQVNTGCNTGAGPYTVDLARRIITFGPIGITKKACIDRTDELETAVLLTIDGTGAYSISASVLTLMDGPFGLQLDGDAAPAK